jgi:hypothetical protein
MKQFLALQADFAAAFEKAGRSFCLLLPNAPGMAPRPASARFAAAPSRPPVLLGLRGCIRLRAAFS